MQLREFADLTIGIERHAWGSVRRHIPLQIAMESWRDIKAIERWWASPSQCNVKRPYSAEMVAKLRDVYPECEHGNLYAKKLRNIFAQHHAKRTASYTFSPTDGIALQRMIEAGFGS